MSYLKAFLPNLRPLTRGLGGIRTPVSVSLRRLTKTRMMFFIAISKQVAESIGFDTSAKGKEVPLAEIGVDERNGTITLINVSSLYFGEDHPPGVWTGNRRDGTLVFAVPPSWIDDAMTKDKRPAERVEFDAGVLDVQRDPSVRHVKFLRITLPDWAAPMRRGTALAQEAADKARQRAGLPPIKRVG